jgi:Xaa-Pro aminopeptidase
MFAKKTYVERRHSLRKELKSGLVLILGNGESPMNYAGNPYPFRQDSNFLYFFGINRPGFIGLMDMQEGKDYLFGEDFTIDDIIWMGPQPTVKELAKRIGASNGSTLDHLQSLINQAVSSGRKIHFLPPYRQENSNSLSRLLGLKPEAISQYSSQELIAAVVKLRSIKSREEIAEIESALETTHKMYTAALNLIKPGVMEREIYGTMAGIANAYGTGVSFPIILTIHGETLHNHDHGNRMAKDQLLLIDSGVQSLECYAADITRTFPVSGSFSQRQRDIYEIVLKSQLGAIKAIKPGKKFRSIHLQVAKTMVLGLKELGLMKGDPGEAVKEGAHALFFPHGLGHMMGLDVHDMEDLGENFVGYDKGTQRSDQFGLAYLRFARELKANFVLTVEPGLYFIPALIDQWKSEKKLASFINYTKVEEYRHFGGIRIEDDVLVTASGSRVLGKPIPKTVAEIEAVMKK